MRLRRAVSPLCCTLPFLSAEGVLLLCVGVRTTAEPGAPAAVWCCPLHTWVARAQPFIVAGRRPLRLGVSDVLEHLRGVPMTHP